MPPNAVASGRHFDKRCTLPELTDLEERMLGRLRTTVNIVKLVSAKNGATLQWGVRGHAISVQHDGLEELAARLPDVAALLGTKVTSRGANFKIPMLAYAALITFKTPSHCTHRSHR